MINHFTLLCNTFKQQVVTCNVLSGRDLLLDSVPESRTTQVIVTLASLRSVSMENTFVLALLCDDTSTETGAWIQTQTYDEELMSFVCA